MQIYGRLVPAPKSFINKNKLNLNYRIFPFFCNLAVFCKQKGTSPCKSSRLDSKSGGTTHNCMALVPPLARVPSQTWCGSRAA